MIIGNHRHDLDTREYRMRIPQRRRPSDSVDIALPSIRRCSTYSHREFVILIGGNFKVSFLCKGRSSIYYLEFRDRVSRRSIHTSAQKARKHLYIAIKSTTSSPR